VLWARLFQSCGQRAARADRQQVWALRTIGGMNGLLAANGSRSLAVAVDASGR
jgi:hypothetical protein